MLQLKKGHHTEVVFAKKRHALTFVNGWTYKLLNWRTVFVPQESLPSSLANATERSRTDAIFPVQRLTQCYMHLKVNDLRLDREPGG